MIYSALNTSTGESELEGIEEQFFFCTRGQRDKETACLKQIHARKTLSWSSCEEVILFSVYTGNQMKYTKWMAFFLWKSNCVIQEQWFHSSEIKEESVLLKQSWNALFNPPYLFWWKLLAFSKHGILHNRSKKVHTSKITCLQRSE